MSQIIFPILIFVCVLLVISIALVLFQCRFWENKYNHLLKELDTKYIQINYILKNAVIRAQEYAEQRRNFFEKMEFEMLLKEIKSKMSQEKEKRFK